jgi:hypothetical protein
LVTAALEKLLAVDLRVTWPESQGTLRRIVGPVLSVPDGDRTVVWFDPLDGRVQASCEVDVPPVTSFVTAVEWPPTSRTISREPLSS